MPEILLIGTSCKNEDISALTYLSSYCKKLSNSFIPYSARLTDKDEQNVQAVISRTPTLNVILVKLKVEVKAGTCVQHI